MYSVIARTSLSQEEASRECRRPHGLPHQFALWDARELDMTGRTRPAAAPVPSGDIPNTAHAAEVSLEVSFGSARVGAVLRREP